MSDQRIVSGNDDTRAEGELTRHAGGGVAPHGQDEGTQAWQFAVSMG